MPFEIDVTLSPKIAPLAWLVGRWEGAGVVGYPNHESHNIGQELLITHDGRPFLEVQSRTWILSEAGDIVRPLATELGFFRVLDDGEVELLLAHPSGIVEMYVGEREAKRPILNLRTDGVIRSPAAMEYNAASRMYGLVDSQLMWVMDMAAEGQPLQSHISAQLKRIG
ncbi:FABP family protein [Gephyromycinifex aptenodytis]|uniref:FABP family protein n=1 Tax=Gephyromycinifex aptenodytis TaxID=2716227 RepID=UPI00144647B9|nr:FABP family protein [Gephyromycinifex aptenodytis]